MNQLSRYFNDWNLSGAWEVGPDVTFESTGDPAHPFRWGLRDTTEMRAHRSLSEMDQAVVLMQFLTLHRFMKRGPVIIRPSVDLCKALIDTDLNFACREYKQPFEVIGVELPREVIGDFAGNLTLVWRPNEDVVEGWTLIKRSGVTYYMSIGNDLPTIEDRLALKEGVEDEADYRMLVLGSRVALNLCMLSACRRTETTPLPRSVQRQREAKNRRQRREALETFQEIRFRDLVVKPRPDFDVMGRFGGRRPKQKRRGHWRNIACGPGFKDHYRSWISEYETHPEESWPGGQPPVTILE